MELSEDEYKELENRVTDILDGDYGINEKHILAIKLENSNLVNKFLKAIQYGEINKKHKNLINKLCDCLEY